MVTKLTTPYRERHPAVTFTVLSATSITVLALLENLEIDAGITYLDNEPLGRVRTVPLYRENYCLITAPSAAFGDRETVTWEEVAGIPLCLLTPDMQNRRIIDRMLRSTGRDVHPTLESNSMVVLWSHVRTGRWASVMPQQLVSVLGLGEAVRAIPIVGGPPSPTVGLVVRHREPMTPLTAALVSLAESLAPELAAEIRPLPAGAPKEAEGPVLGEV